MNYLLLIAITILAVGCGEKNESTSETKPVEEKALEVNGKVIPKEPVAEAKPESKSVSTDQIEKKALEVNEKVIPKESVAEAKPESKSVSTDEMEIREGLGYVRGSDVPYTGKVSKLYESGQKELELNVKDGKYDGLVVWWHQNGQKKSEENWKDGKMTYEKFWNSKGEKVDSKEEAE